jgi:eukaryotic-like serine/threonine-protein kinase
MEEKRTLGRYELVMELGKGAMGTVYKAHDPLLDRTIAIKTINISGDEPEVAEYEARFYQEAKVAGRLNHRNIITVYDVATSDDMPYLAMELLEGYELGRLLGSGQPLPVAHALDIAAQVADGLAYAHVHGVVHRDIKPANLMVTPDSLVKIADFGIARMRSAERGAEQAPVLGSPRYMSPEQVLRKRAEQRSDIFSLGVVLYEMLTGAPPFTGADLNAIVFQIVNLVPPAPSTVSSSIPEMVDFIVAKALAKAPDDRYPDAQQLADDLRQCRKHLDAPAPLSSLDIFKPSVTRLDPYAATPLLAQSYPEARRSDHQRPVPEGDSSLGLAKGFDSFSATARLALHTGAGEEFADLVKKPPSVEADTMPVYGTLVREQSSPRVVPRLQQSGRWERRDKLLFGASVAVALVIAVIIVIV